MNKLFKKIFLYQLLVLTIGCAFIVVGTNFILERYFIEEKTHVLLEHARGFEEIYDASGRNSSIDLELLIKDVINLRKFTDADLMIISPLAEIVVNTGYSISNPFARGFSYYDFSDGMKGNITTKKSTIKTRYGFEQFLIVGYPIVEDGKTECILVLSLPMWKISTQIRDISIIILFSLAIVGIIGIILLRFFMNRIGSDIMKFKNLVDYVAEGNFDRKIEINKNTELEDLAMKFNDMADELAKIDEGKRQFISNLSHDLRSPLTSISGYTQGILDGTIPYENQQKYIKVVHDESIRLSKMINDILDLNRLESGDVLLSWNQFDINSTIVEILDKLEKRIMDKKIDIDISFYDEKIFAYGDIHAYSRVIYNLFDNAIKFINEEGSIYIKTQIHDSKILVSVRNSTPYIPEEQLKNIWKRFYKIDSSRGMEKNSSGIGLSIISQIIKEHGEKIDVKSNPELGVEFIFSVAIFKNQN